MEGARRPPIDTAHLENVPGFPAGVNSRTCLQLLESQAGRNGCLSQERLVTDLRPVEAGFKLRVEADEEFDLRAGYDVTTSWADVDYLDAVDGVGLIDRGSKTYVDVGERGVTGVNGLYAGGRIAA